jgi:hypothetical protein
MEYSQINWPIFIEVLKEMMKTCLVTHKETGDNFYLGRATGFETVVKMIEEKGFYGKT